jgi:flavin reductase (DIM6/NTAB) family NADH-FMN oxidoreductase RutF
MRYESDAMTESPFQAIAAAMDVPLIVVTTSVGSERAGCLVGFHAQSSITPERYCIWLSKANHTYRVGLRAAYFALHFLTDRDLPLAKLFGTQTGDTVDKFANLDLISEESRAPVLQSCQHRLVVQRVALLDENGDHVCISTQPVSASSTGTFKPLRLSHARHLTAGHENEERHNPPTERAAD